MLENLHGFMHVSDVMSANAIGSTIGFVVAVISLKLIATIAGAMVRDDARKMAWYRRNVEGYTGDSEGNGTPEA